MSEHLLTVRAAADILGVHVDTIRRWTDEGRLPETRTPGGHRRIPREAVERLRATETGSAPTTSPLPDSGGPADQAWARHALVHARYELEAGQERPWAATLTDADRQRSRENGQRLLGLLLQHVSGTVEEDALWPEVRRLTRVYARQMRDRGMPYQAALKAALFFRDVLSESTAFYPAAGPHDGVALVRKVNAFTNEVQLAIAEAFGVEDPVDGPEGEA